MRTLAKALLAFMLPLSATAQSEFALDSQTLPNNDNEPLAVHPVPSERQIKWNETEFYAFFHYGMNTFTDMEWGNGDEAESTYAPLQKPDPEQWLTAAKAAGMKGGIAVVKHHDGFCLWPTSTTTHNISKAGNEYGRSANIPQLFGEAARKLDMKYGFYISPWDRNSKYYGEDNYVTDVFMKQCAELAEYGGDQFEMWFDGANGGSGYYGGKNTTVSVDKSIYYDIPNLRDSVHKVCPNCVMWGEGGEARWIGNESGYAGETNWGMVDRGTITQAQMPYGQENGWVWEAGESDAKCTESGWFWHSGEGIKSAERLFQMYLETVGRNATWILNCPPDNRGLLPDQTVNRLKELGNLLTNRLGTDLAKDATITASETRAAGVNRNYEPTNMKDGDKDTYWATNDGTTQAAITLEWPSDQTVRYVMLQEYIRKGQRVESFSIETSMDGSTWAERATAIPQTTIGYKRIIPLNGSTSSSYGTGYKAKYLRLTIKASRACPLISNLCVY